MDVVKNEGVKKCEDFCVDNNADSPDSVSKDVEQSEVESDDANLLVEVQMELDSGRRIISEIMKQNKTTCWPFMDVVDAEGLGLWDYHTKIKEPMWLNKILEKFNNKEYSSFADFAKDFRIMVENCYRYNTTEHPISKKAKRLEMLFEGKLALLKKGIRENATIAKTSNGRFATLADEGNSTMRSGRISIPANGGSREADGESQGRLVYDFVRCEEATLAEDERQASYRERKQQQTLYQQFAAAFVSSLESREDAKHIKRCHHLPAIGIFLHLNESTLRLPPLAMYNLEMSLLIPSDSLYLAKIMTSFLCTYFERSLINQRNPMTFKTWERRLKQRLEKWYETVSKYNSYIYAADKLCIGVDFFHDMKWKNPFISVEGKEKSFLDFTYDEKAAIIKAVCDNMTSFQSVQNNIASLPCEQSRVMSLGYDVAGNEYTYFPQFCGDDVRVYRHRRYGELTMFETPDPTLVLKDHKSNLRADETKLQPDDDDNCALGSELFESKMTQNGDMETELSGKDSKPIDISEVVDVQNSETSKVVNKDDFIESEKVTNDLSTSQESSTSAEPKCNEKQPCESLREIDDHEKTSNDIEQCYLDADSQESVIKNKLDNSLEISDFMETDVMQISNSDTNFTVPAANEHCEEDTVSDQAQVKSESILPLHTDDDKNQTQNSTSDVECSHNSLVKKDSLKHQENTDFTSSPIIDSPTISEKIHESLRGCKTQKSLPRKKSHKKKIIPEESASSPLRRSSRKRNAVNYTSMLVASEPPTFALPEPDNCDNFVPTKKQKQTKKIKYSRKATKIAKVEEPEEEYGSVDFELVCDGLSSLRQLITSVEQEHQDAIKDKKPRVVVNNVASLLEKLEWLVGELRSFETHLEKARFDARIQLKREHDMIFRDATTGKAIHSTSPDVDPWEDEILSKNTMVQGENASTYNTPPASIYLEESDEESDREIRRSKRRPKKYESDEDFVVDSTENSPSYQVSTTFLYDEFDEDRLRLIPAALDELEERLQKQAQTLQKMMGGGRVTRQSEFKEANQLLTNERRTRQRSKKENKMFRKVLLLALKEKEYGPSLLPLLRTDQVEIGEVVEHVLEQEVIARQQRRLAREEEQRKKRAFKQAVQQKTKAARATHRAANKLVAKYKQDRHETKVENQQPTVTKAVTNPTTMFSPPKKNTTIPSIQSSSNPYHVLTTNKTENVMIRLQNGKICQALKFSDGRVVPIVRMGNTTKASTFENLTQRTGILKKGTKIQVHPHISLTSRRAPGVSVPKQQATLNKEIFSNATSPSLSTRIQQTGIKGNVANPAINTASKLVTNASEVGKQLQSTVAPIPSQPVKVVQQSKPVMSTGRTVLSPTGVSQRLTLPSGQVINLLVKSQAEAAMNKAPTQSLGKMFVDNIDSDMGSSIAVSHNVAPVTPSTPSIVLSRPVHNLSSEAPPRSDTINSSIPGQSISSVTSKNAKPLGVVAPMQIKHPNSMSNLDGARQNSVQYSAPQTGIRYSTTQQANFISPVMATPGRPRYQEGQPVIGTQEPPSIHYSASQQSYLGMQNVALVSQPVYHRQPTAQPMQLVPTMMAAGSVPLVQPVQYVQTVPIPVQAPLLFVAPNQAPLRIGGVDSTQYMQSTQSATHAPETITTQPPQQLGRENYSPDK